MFATIYHGIFCGPDRTFTNVTGKLLAQDFLKSATAGPFLTLTANGASQRGGAPIGLAAPTVPVPWEWAAVARLHRAEASADFESAVPRPCRLPNCFFLLRLTQ